MTTTLTTTRPSTKPATRPLLATHPARHHYRDTFDQDIPLRESSPAAGPSKTQKVAIAAQTGTSYATTTATGGTNHE